MASRVPGKYEVLRAFLGRTSRALLFGWLVGHFTIECTLVTLEEWRCQGSVW